MKFSPGRRDVLKAALSSTLLSPFAAVAGERRQLKQTGAEAYEVTQTELPLAGLPQEHDGLKIAQLSDLHVGRNTPDGRILSAVRRINELQPDVVFLTGDYVTRASDPLERVPIVLKGLLAPCFAVMGNHDHWADAAWLGAALEKSGYTVLRNQHAVIRLRGRDLAVVGVDDAVTRHDDCRGALDGSEHIATRLVLAHAPPTADKLPSGANLACFSGHTHGGHFVIPGVTERIFRGAGQPYIRGLYEVNGNKLYVNRGLGFGRGGPVARMGAEPEVSLFTLRRA